MRDRSRRELERRLLRAGFEREDVAEALDRLERAGLVDDERFARALAEHTIGVRGDGRRSATSALLAKGVARDLVEQAVAEAAVGDEEARALVLARRRAPRLAGLEPGVAMRRLTGFLARRGYDPGTAARAAARALAVDQAPVEGP